MERSDDDILDPRAMAAVFGVNQRTIVKMAREGRAPVPIGGFKPPYRWRWGAVKKWHQAMETLYGVGFVTVVFDEKGPDFVEDSQNRSDDEPPTSKKGK